MKAKYHLLYWLFEYLYHCFTHFSNFDTKIDIISLTIILQHTVFKIIFFYVALIYAFPIFFNGGHYKFSRLTFFLIIVFSLFIISNINILLFDFYPKLEGDDTANYSWLQDFLSTIWTNLLVLPVAFAFYYIDQNITIAEEQRAIEHQNNLLEQSIIKEKLSGLRMQINPAFLEKTLAYFYRESLPYSPNLSKGITLLSDMMKYALNEDDKEGKVPLKNEIKHIRNFIEIQQLRFDNRLQVHFEVSGEVKTNLLCLCY